MIDSHFSNPANLSNLFLFSLIPITLILMIIWFVSLLGSCLPFLAFFSIPTFLLISIILIYCISFIPYLLFAQSNPPEGTKVLVLPLSPIKVIKVFNMILRQIHEIIKLNLIEIILDYSYRRIIVIGSNKKHKFKILKENILYDSNRSNSNNHRLDIYFPIDWSSNQNQSSTSSNHHHLQTDFELPHHHESNSNSIPNTSLAPIIFFIHPGGWSITSKGLYIQLALRFRRLGFCVVIPNFTQFPEGRCEDSISDLRKALAWVQRSAHQYGGDGNRVYLLGHGSGAHLALLTVVQHSIINSIQFNSSSKVLIPIELYNQLKLSLNHDQSFTLNQIKGLILLSGIYDPIKQVRFESKLGWELISTLRRSLGPSYSKTLLNSPNHLLFNFKELLKINPLPFKVLFIHGGLDKNVPILQSVLCKTLLSSLGLKDVRLRAYRELGHLDSLFSIMMDGRRYSNLIDSEIISLVTS